MAPLCSSGEGSTHRKCPSVDTRSVRRASGLLETGFSVTCRPGGARTEELAERDFPGTMKLLAGSP